jgi:hypothetical protein
MIGKILTLMRGEKKMVTIKIKQVKPRDLIAMDLRTSKYRMRVVKSKKSYNRHVENQQLKKELTYG